MKLLLIRPWLGAVLVGLVCLSALAEGFATIQYRAPVFQRASEESKILFYVQPGETLDILDKSNADYLKVSVLRSGKKRVGYVPKVAASEISDTNESDLDADLEGGASVWWFGGGAVFSSFSQGSRSFSTQDEVKHTTTSYESQTLSPFLSLQYQNESFWRLVLAYKQVRFKAKDQTDISESAEKPITLDYNMVSIMVEKVWEPFYTRHFYVGFAAEFAQALSSKLTIDASPTDTPKVTYYSASLLAGGCFKLGQQQSVYTEARVGVIPNQAPTIIQLEASLGILRRY